MKSVCRLIFLLILCHCLILSAEEQSKDTPQAKIPAKEESVDTTHSITLNSVEIKYKATAGTMLLKNDKSDPKASLFYVAYIKEGENDKTKRPITFCFNGGPGS